MWRGSSCADIRSGASADNYGRNSVVVECRKVHLEEEVEKENISIIENLAVVVVVVVVPL